MNNSPSALQVLGAVWAFVVWLPRSSWSSRAPSDDTSGRFPFGVKGGLVIELSRPIAEVAREIQVNETTLGAWVAKYRAEHVDDEPPLTISERARLREL